MDPRRRGAVPRRPDLVADRSTCSRSRSCSCGIGPAVSACSTSIGCTRSCVTWARGDRARGVVQRGFELFLALADVLGYRIVWTAHNLLPHVPVFRDDVAARRVLVATKRRGDRALAHTRLASSSPGGPGQWWSSRKVPISSRRPARRIDARLGTRSAWTRRGPWSCSSARCSRTRASTSCSMRSQPCRRASRSTSSWWAGAVTMPLREDLEARAARAGERVRTRFAFVPDAELAGYLAAGDFAVFPFRAVTNSSSVATALGARPPGDRAATRSAGRPPRRRDAALRARV